MWRFVHRNLEREWQPCQCAASRAAWGGPAVTAARDLTTGRSRESATGGARLDLLLNERGCQWLLVSGPQLLELECPTRTRRAAAESGECRPGPTRPGSESARGCRQPRACRSHESRAVVRTQCQCEAPGRSSQRAQHHDSMIVTRTLGSRADGLTGCPSHASGRAGQLQGGFHPRFGSARAL